jgi:hypothetical protein
MSDTPPELDHVEEFKIWSKKNRLETKLEDQAVMSYFKRFDIKALCGGKMAVVHSAVERLAELLRDQEFREKTFAAAGAIAELYPLVRRAPQRRGLRVELWADDDLKLKSALVSDGFRCVSASGCSPQVYYGDGELERYRDLVRQPNTVSIYAATGVVRGRAAADAGEPTGANTESPSEMHSNPKTVPAPDGDPARRRALRAAAARVTGAKVFDGRTYEPPPLGTALHLLVETEAADQMLIAIVRREGEPDLAAIVRHLRGSFDLGPITTPTKGKIETRLKALCATSALQIDEQGRYRVPTRTVDPTGSLDAGTRDGGRSDAGVPDAEEERKYPSEAIGGRTEAAEDEDPSGLRSATSGAGGLHEAEGADADAADHHLPHPAPSPGAADGSG